MPERRHRRAGEPRHQVADESDGDDDRAGRDHRHGHRVEELVLGEPAVLLDDALVQERHDRQAAAEHERPGLGEEEQDLEQDDCPCRLIPACDHASMVQAATPKSAQTS